VAVKFSRVHSLIGRRRCRSVSASSNASSMSPLGRPRNNRRKIRRPGAGWREKHRCRPHRHRAARLRSAACDPEKFSARTRRHRSPDLLSGSRCSSCLPHVTTSQSAWKRPRSAQCLPGRSRAEGITNQQDRSIEAEGTKSDHGAGSASTKSANSGCCLMNPAT
jgi:hypothetical protein